MRVLIVDDDKKLAALIQEGLTTRGFSCDMAHSLREADHCLGMAAYPLIVLDRGLPDGDGVAWLRLRRHTSPGNVLVLTGRNSPGERQEGLEAGAADYLAKPFDMEDLLSRALALVDRPPQSI